MDYTNFEGPDDAEAAAHSVPPSLRLTGSETSDRGNGVMREMLHLQLNLSGPAWGIMNVTGPLTGWSLTPTAPPVSQSQVRPSLKLLA
jgi:hypothetical protein